MVWMSLPMRMKLDSLLTRQQLDNIDDFDHPDSNTDGVTIYKTEDRENFKTYALSHGCSKDDLEKDMIFYDGKYVGSTPNDLVKLVTRVFGKSQPSNGGVD